MVDENMQSQRYYLCKNKEKMFSHLKKVFNLHNILLFSVVMKLLSAMLRDYVPCLYRSGISIRGGWKLSQVAFMSPACS
jgi:hypothetical protein